MRFIELRFILLYKCFTRLHYSTTSSTYMNPAPPVIRMFLGVNFAPARGSEVFVSGPLALLDLDVAMIAVLPVVKGVLFIGKEGRMIRFCLITLQ